MTTDTPASSLEPLYQDEALVAVSKPPGEAVIAERGGAAEACLRRRLESQLGERLWVVHRIDRDASGLVVFARTAETHRALSLAFEHREVEKTYAAFVGGAFEVRRGRIETPLHAARRGKTRPARPGEPGQRAAATDYEVRQRWLRGEEAVSLLDVRPHTGRHHQIRVHLRSIGAPLLFDPLYGRGRDPAGLEAAPSHRLALHARCLVLPSPLTGSRLTLEAPLAEDLRQLRSWLDAEWKTAPLPARDR